MTTVLYQMPNANRLNLKCPATLWGGSEEVGKSLSDTDALDLIGPLLKTVKKEYQEAEKWLKNWYSKKGVDLDAME